jgi:putative NADPH-quinone reductase
VLKEVKETTRPKRSKRVTIIQGHPDPAGGHFGHALAEAYASGAREAGHQVDVLQVSQLDFPLLSNNGEFEKSTPPDSIRLAQSAIARADHLVFVYPVWDGTIPARLKGFLEQTFRPSFLYPRWRPGMRLGFRSFFTEKKVLRGKTARVVATMGMPAFIYRWYFRPHIEKSVLRMGGIRKVRDTLIGRVDSNERRRSRWLDRMQGLGRLAV